MANVNLDIIGLIHAIPQSASNNIFNKHKRIYVKFLPPRVKKINIDLGKKLLFLISNSKKRVRGEAIISNIEFLFKKELVKKYNHNIFISPKELNSYCLGREDRKMLVLTLSEIKEYTWDVFSNKIVTMGGMYITKEEYKKLIKKRQKIKQ